MSQSAKDPSDEIMKQMDEKMRKNRAKDFKALFLMHHKDEKHVFDSGEYYRDKEIEKMSDDDGFAELDKQAKLILQKAGTHEKKTLKDMCHKGPVSLSELTSLEVNL